MYRGFEGYWAKYSEWYQFPEMIDNVVAQCMGFDHYEPLIWFDSKRLVLTFEGKGNRISTDDLCDQYYQRSKLDPNMVFYSRTKKEQVQKLINEYAHHIRWLNDKDYLFQVRKLNL